MHLKNLPLTWKLALLCGLPIAGLAAFAAVTYQTLGQVRVQGPAYTRIILGKDLIADILPPPAYVIETDQVGAVLTEPLHPERTARFLIRHRTEDDIPPEGDPGARVD